MRKTRILASLLCLLMVATAIPMMQASAATVTPDGVLHIPEMLWSDNFDDGDKNGWTDRVAGFEVTQDNGNNVLHAAATTTTGGATIQTQNAAFNLKDKDFTFRFKMKMAGGEKGFAPLNATFGNYTTAKGQNVGFSGASLGMDMGKWYEWAYVYSYDAEGTDRVNGSGAAVTGTQTLDIWSRYQNQDGTWSAWTENVSNMAVATYQSTATLIKFTFGQISGNQLATDVWYDDFMVYTHDASVDNVNYAPYTAWTDDFTDNDISDWTNNTNFEVVNVGGNKMLHTSTAGATITYSNNKVLQLRDKNFTLRFKSKLDLPEGGTGYSNISANFGNYTTASTQNLGWSGLAMTDECWYEWMYVYSYDAEGTGRVDGSNNAVTGSQEVKIYSRCQSANGDWDAWVLENTLPVAKYQGTATSLKFTFPTAANQQATDVWYDDFVVYTHENKVQPLTIKAPYADKVSATIERNPDNVVIAVTEIEDGAADGLTMFLAEYGADTLESVQKVNGTAGSYTITLPQNDYRIFFWDGNLTPVFDAISK